MEYRPEIDCYAALGQDHPILDDSEMGEWARIQLVRVWRQRNAMLNRAGGLNAPLAHSFYKLGKFFRPLLLLGFSALSARTQNPCDEVISAAAAIELLHECSLLHDDIADRSMTRRGQDSVAAAFGVRTAAHSGAFLAGMGIAALAGSCRRSGIVIDLHPLRDLPKAQIVEALPPSRNVGEQLARTCSVAYGKTGVLLRFAVELGARFNAAAGGLAFREEDLKVFPEALALGYQIRDDVLDLERDVRLRRPGNSDLQQGIPSWPVTHWVASQPDQAVAWQALENSAGCPTAAAALRAEILNSHAFSEARAAVEEHLQCAWNVLENLPPSTGRQLLTRILQCLRLT